MIHPELLSVPTFYQGYVNLVKDLDLFDALRISNENTTRIIASVVEEKGEYRYQTGKWSIKEVICHMMDAERVFAYRALRFSRNDKTPLPPFEENDYVPESNAHSRTLHQLMAETKRLRETTVDLYASFTPAMLKREGVANKTVISVLNLGFIIAGHETHHGKILTERYLKN